MALNNLVDKFEEITLANADAKTFHYGHLSEANLLSHKEFPLVLLSTLDGFDDERAKRSTHDVRIFIIDTYNKDKKDTIKVHEHEATLKEIGRTIWNLSVLPSLGYVYDKSNRPFFFYENAFNGLYNIAEYRANVQIGLTC